MDKRRSGRVPSSSFRMPSQMKSLFFGDDDSGKNRPKKFLQVHSNPSIYLIRNFLSNSQMEYFDKMCTEYDPKFKTSFTGTDSDEEVISSERTSKFISLSKAQDKFVRDIEEKSAGLVGLSQVNVEPLQIVSYAPGQHFNLHHDAGTLLDDGRVPTMVPPRRLVTVFLYLNSLPEGEGHTEFPRLKLSVRPEKNCALLFCNTTRDLNEPDPLVVHCAQPLSSAPRHPSMCCKKYGVNIWLTDTDLSELSCGRTLTPLPRHVTAVASRNRKRRRDSSSEVGWHGEHSCSALACAGSGGGGAAVEGVLTKAERKYHLWVQSQADACREDNKDFKVDDFHCSQNCEHDNTSQSCEFAGGGGGGSTLEVPVNDRDKRATLAAAEVEINSVVPPSPPSFSSSDLLSAGGSVSLLLAHSRLLDVTLRHPVTGNSYITSQDTNATDINLVN